MSEDQENPSDGAVHTASEPYCGEVSCWCHSDADYHAAVTAPFGSDEIDTQGAYDFFGLEVAA